MNILRVVVMVAAVLSYAVSSQSQARKVAVLSYQELLNKSDLVVIAAPKSKTTDTKERAFLPNIWLQEKDGKKSIITSVGVETVFAVSAILKGDKSAKTFTLHHYREAHSPAVERHGPALVSFDPSDASQRSSYLLFLVHESDGRFAPTGAQTDPGFKSITRLPFEPYEEPLNAPAD